MTNEQKIIRNKVGLVKLAETLGFDGAWFAEHRVAGFAFGSPAMFIAACARETQRIRLGSAISLLPLNNPVRIAEDYAMADVLSHGRLDFGAGRGLCFLRSPPVLPGNADGAVIVWGDTLFFRVVYLRANTHSLCLVARPHDSADIPPLFPTRSHRRRSPAYPSV